MSIDSGDARELRHLAQEYEAALRFRDEAQSEVDFYETAIKEVEEGGPTPDEVAAAIFGRAVEAIEMDAWFDAPAFGEGS